MSRVKNSKPQGKRRKEVTKTIAGIVRTSEKRLEFELLDITSMLMAIFVDATFATKPDVVFQLGSFPKVPIEANNKINIINYESVRPKRITRRVIIIITKLFAMIH